MLHKSDVLQWINILFTYTHKLNIIWKHKQGKLEKGNDNDKNSTTTF